MKAALYIRVSTDEQAREGVSIHEQKERLQAYALSQGWSGYQFYMDEGYSAKDFNRPSYQQMKKDIASGHIQAVVTTKIDRLTRRLIDLLQFVEFLDECQCVYKSSSESFDTGSAAGRMVLQLLGVFAEFERERIAERVRENMSHLAKQGKPISRPCFGYNLVEKQLVINETEAKWVHTMAEWFLAGLGTFQIAKKLNEHQVPTKNGGSWSAKAVRQFFEHNEMLIGNLIWNKQRRKGKKRIQNPTDEWLKVLNSHPPILELSVFQRIQEKLTRSKPSGARTGRHRYLLSGLVRCGHCGSRMIGSSVKSNETSYIPRYICSNYQKKGLCFNHWIHSSTLETYVLGKLVNLFDDSKQSSALGDSTSTKKHKNSLSRELINTEKNVLKIEEKSRKQLEAYEAGIITLQELREAKERLHEQKKELQKKSIQLRTLLEGIGDLDFKTLVNRKVEEMKQLGDKELVPFQQNVIQEMIHEINIYNGNEIEICYLSLNEFHH